MHIRVRLDALLAILVLGGMVPSSPAAAAELTGNGFDVLAYEVALRPDFVSRSMTGDTEIELRSTQDGLRSLVFSDNALVLDRVTVDGRPVRVTRADGRLTFDLPRPLRAGRRATVRVVHHGAPTQGVTYGARSIHTTYFACAWMICAQDAFGDKASIQMSLTLPAGMMSIGPGTLRSKTRTRAGEERHVWRETRDYPAYVYAFAAGNYVAASHQEGSVDLVYASEVATPEELARLFAPTPAMLRFFEEKAGVPFPQQRYIQLLVDGGAAQEALSHAVIGRRMLDPMLATPEEDWVIAHEIAHQWWGNLITCASLDHFWLNEGITTFMVAAWKEQAWGRAAYDREMEIARNGAARAEAAGMNVPLSYAGSYPSIGIRRAIQYSKGALFMDHLRRELGDEAFWAGLKRFTRTHAGGTVDSHDAQAAFETASGRDLDAIFQEWVF